MEAAVNKILLKSALFSQASAFQVEEELQERQREKAASLRRFQGEVRRRVNQQVRMRRKLQLQESCEAVRADLRPGLAGETPLKTKIVGGGGKNPPC